MDLHDLFDTYETKLFERFRDLGVDLTDGHAMAWTLARHTSNTPLSGFARKHRKSDPKIQDELNAALAYHAQEGNERGVGLCLWAGADPHAPAPDLRHGRGSDEHEEEYRYSAVYEACSAGNLGILQKLDPDPEKDDFDDLYRVADSRRVIEYLAGIAPPPNPDQAIKWHLWEATFESPWSSSWGSTRTLKALFEAGLRWRDSTKDELANIRRWLLKTSDQTLIETMKLLAKDDYAAPEILHEIARTPAMRRRMREVGFLPVSDDEPNTYVQPRPTRFREVQKAFGAIPPKKERPPPRVVRIGWSHRGAGQELRMTRKELYDRVWTEPVTKVAEAWGISDNGLRKQCRRLKIPLPGRGYWPKVRAGKKPRRPRLPKLPEGQGEEIVVWVEA